MIEVDVLSVPVRLQQMFDAAMRRFALLPESRAGGVALALDTFVPLRVMESRKTMKQQVTVTELQQLKNSSKINIRDTARTAMHTEFASDTTGSSLQQIMTAGGSLYLPALAALIPQGMREWLYTDTPRVARLRTQLRMDRYYREDRFQKQKQNVVEYCKHQQCAQHQIEMSREHQLCVCPAFRISRQQLHQRLAAMDVPALMFDDCNSIPMHIILGECMQQPEEIRKRIFTATGQFLHQLDLVLQRQRDLHREDLDAAVDAVTLQLQRSK